jgi:hypothetical protein
MNTPNPKTPTAAAIATAVRNAAKMIGQGYEVKQSVCIAEIWFVIKPNTNRRFWYTVDTTQGFRSCTCEQFKEEGVCKHQVTVDEEIAIRAREADLEMAGL